MKPIFWGCKTIFFEGRLNGSHKKILYKRNTPGPTWSTHGQREETYTTSLIFY